jgi:hypothetical protein
MIESLIEAASEMTMGMDKGDRECDEHDSDTQNKEKAAEIM